MSLHLQRRHPYRLLGMTATVAVAALLPTSPARAQAPEPSAALPTIVTTGEATISRPPDVAYLTIAVETRASSPREAERLNAESMSAVQKQLTDAGIGKEAIRTVGLWLDQEFDTPNGRRVSRGFVARHLIEARLDAVSRAGEVADAVVKGGATSLNGIRFDLKDRAAAEREALRAAVVDARQRAEAAAAGAGRTVDRILKIEDTRNAPIVGPRVMALRAEPGGGPATTPVEPGVVEIHAKATLTVSMK